MNTASTVLLITFFALSISPIAEAQERVLAPDSSSSESVRAMRDTVKVYHLRQVNVEGMQPVSSTIHRDDGVSQTLDHLRTSSGGSVLADFLPMLTSEIAIREYGGPGSVALASYRGLPAEYTIVYRDGIRLNNEQNSLTDFGRDLGVSLESIEIIPSTASILLGGDAIGASVNLISHSARQTRFEIGSSLSAFGGSMPISEADYTGRVDLRVSERFGISLSASAENSDGSYPFLQNSTGVTVLRSNNDSHVRDFGLNATYALNEADQLPSDLQVMANYSSANRGVPGAASINYLGATEPNARQTDADYFSALRWKGELGKGTRITTSFSFQSQYETFDNPRIRVADHYLNQIYAFDAKNEMQLASWLKAFDGISISRSLLFSNENYVQIGDSLISRNRGAGFIAVELTPVPDFDFVVASRVESTSKLSPQFLPQLSAEYSPLSVLKVGAAFAASYHAPTLNELYWKEGGNSNLLEERAKTVDAFIALRPDITEHLVTEIKLTAFRTSVENQIIWQPGAQFYTPSNIQSTRDEGIECALDVRYAIESQWSIHVHESYTLLAALNTSPNPIVYNKEVPYSAPTNSQFIAELESAQLGSLSLRAEYRGHRFTDAGNTVAAELPPSVVYDASLATSEVAIAGRASVAFQLSIRNLLNEQYAEFQGYPMPGRTVRLSIRASFGPKTD